VSGGESEDSGKGGKRTERSSVSASSKGGGIGILFPAERVVGKILKDFGGEDTEEICGDIVSSETFSDFLGQGTVSGLIQRSDPDLGWVESKSGAHGGDDRNISFDEFGKERDFGSKCIDGVNNEMGRACEDGLEGFDVNERLESFDLTGGINIEEAFFRDVNFWEADGGMQCEELAVDIAGMNDVEIDESDVAYTAAGECFGSEASDGTEADNGDKCILEFGKGLTPEQHFDSVKRIGVVVG